MLGPWVAYGDDERASVVRADVSRMPGSVRVAAVLDVALEYPGSHLVGFWEGLGMVDDGVDVGNRTRLVSSFAIAVLNCSFGHCYLPSLQCVGGFTHACF